eukprot:TRINITY_DN25582_c1_g1_i1.p1 TRINITY_DN25582_c1_g1~~TRINITY_DN25582_c1_g1_i1.p1  ORF type:complete len:301 (-),score=75.13 TRINITY_DN25582_c1_g1_i1:43-834(-)
MAVVRAHAADTTGEAAPSVPRLLTKPKEGEYIELPKNANVVNVFVTFETPRSETAQLAFWIEDASDPSRRGQLNLLPSVPTEEYALQGIPAGSHRVRAVLWNAPPGVKPSSAADLQRSGGEFEILSEDAVVFCVRRFEEFQPSYEWARVEEWHLPLPPGLEINMELGGHSSARIPRTWKWDVRVSSDASVAGEGETRHVRIDVDADATIGVLLDRAGLSREAYEVVWRQPGGGFERILEPSWTARQANLFQYSRDMLIRLAVE